MIAHLQIFLLAILVSTTFAQIPPDFIPLFLTPVLYIFPVSLPPEVPPVTPPILPPQFVAPPPQFVVAPTSPPVLPPQFIAPPPQFVVAPTSPPPQYVAPETVPMISLPPTLPPSITVEEITTVNTSLVLTTNLTLQNNLTITGTVFANGGVIHSGNFCVTLQNATLVASRTGPVVEGCYNGQFSQTQLPKSTCLSTQPLLILVQICDSTIAIIVVAAVLGAAAIIGLFLFIFRRKVVTPFALRSRNHMKSTQRTDNSLEMTDQSAERAEV